jgi:hypothetical protein
MREVTYAPVRTEWSRRRCDFVENRAGDAQIGATRLGDARGAKAVLHPRSSRAALNKRRACRLMHRVRSALI